MIINDDWKIETGYIDDDFIYQRITVVCSIIIENTKYGRQFRYYLYSQELLEVSGSRELPINDNDERALIMNKIHRALSL